jgi:dTDP-4-amino-4,6-dideoxygalactose transaminase
MAAKGIECGIHYPIPIHYQEAYSECKHLSFPVAASQAGELVSMPLSAGINV